jgi:hypothetical protein
MIVGISPLFVVMVIVPTFLKVTLTWKLAFYLAFSQGFMLFIMGWWIAVTNVICITSQRLVDDFKVSFKFWRTRTWLLYNV